MLIYNGLEDSLVEPNVILQITGCDDAWAGDLEEETKAALDRGVLWNFGVFF